MHLSASGAFIALLCPLVLAQTTLRLASPEYQPTPVPSQTFYGTATVPNAPECTGCLLEAIHPTLVSYPGTVYCIDKYTISTVPSLIRYTTTKPDGCTDHIYSPYTASTGPVSTTSITWDANGTTLTWPTTYLAYSTFQAGTWSHDGGSDCTIHPTTVSAQSPIIYPASSLPGSLAPVPSQVVQSIIDDPSINLSFDIGTCTANGALPSPLRADPEPECSCTAPDLPPPSCIRLPPITTTILNTFTHAGYRRRVAATPPALLHMRLNAAEAAGDVSHEETHTVLVQRGTIDGGKYTRSTDDEGTNSPAATATSSTPTTSSSSSSTSSTSLESSGSTSSANSGSSSSFVA